MVEHREIYSRHAERYDVLVSREDYQQHILGALSRILPLDGLTVVELGAGTGRLTCLLVPAVGRIHAFDRSQHMLDAAAAKLRKLGRFNWSVAVGDHRQVPMEAGAADAVIAGWSVCYIIEEHGSAWETELSKTLDEMRRILRPGGVIVLLETLGTGVEVPEPPAGLVRYYEWLEKKGFQRRWIRTDYRFQDRTEGETLARFFFGEEMAAKLVQDERGVILPECTGIWWMRPTGVPLMEPISPAG
ncbi:MAG: class I SAM-dependent methyltransferase [Bacteroidota bacterium]